MKSHTLMLILCWIGLQSVLAQKIPPAKLMETGETLRGIKGVSVRVVAKNFSSELESQIATGLKAHGVQVASDGTYPILSYSITEASSVFGRVVGTGYYAQLTLQQAIPSGTKFIVATTYDDGQEMIGGPLAMVNAYQNSLDQLLGDFLVKFDEANGKAPKKAALPAPTTGFAPMARSSFGRWSGEWAGNYQCPGVAAARTTWIMSEEPSGHLTAQGILPDSPKPLMYSGQINDTGVRLDPVAAGGYTVTFGMDRGPTGLAGWYFGPNTCSVTLDKR
jgi:hypothetical protein